jgi:fatty-acyl-CoA synthase
VSPDRIRSLADLREIERAGMARWMPHAHVFDALQAVARRHPDRPALTAMATAADACPAGWTYRQLLADIVRAANALRALDAAPRVALLLPPLPAAWITLWAAETAGTAIPINPALSDAHLLALLQAADANVVVTLAPGHPAGDIGDRVAALRSRCPVLRQVLTVGAAGHGSLAFDELLAAQDGSALGFAPEASPAAVAALFHTGGTTGLPKLAQHTHANQLHAAWGAARLYDATPEDVILNGFPLFHVAGAFVYGLSMLLTGAQIVLPPPAGWRDAAFVARAWALVRERGVTLLAMVPTVMTALLAAPRAPGDADGVRLGLTGGSPLPPELATRFESETGVPVRNILGMTECAGVIAIEPAAAPRTAGSCGLPLPFSEVRVDAMGVLRVRGPNVGPGYSDPARNAGSFEDGWLISGDIGHLDAQGRVHVTGRAKDVIIRGAHNIDPAVIEEALLRHPQVALAAAVGEPDEYAGELPVAYVVARPGEVVDGERLLDFLRPQVPERAAVPRRISVLPSLPLTAIGKVYKPALRLQAALRVVGERLQSAGLADQVDVDGEDRGGQLLLRLRRRGGADAALDTRLQALMAGFALAWELA